MRVLVLTPVYPHPNNPTEGLFNEQHALALKTHGVDVTVVLCKQWLPGGIARVWRRYRFLADLPRVETRNGIRVVLARYIHVPKYRLPTITVGSCARSIQHATEPLQSGNPFDVIQVHSVWQVGLAAPKVAKRLGRPFVVTLHIEDDPRMLATARGVRLHEAMCRQASALVAVGTPLEQAFRRALPAALGVRVRRIPNGVDLELIGRLAADLPGSTRGYCRIVSVCNLWPTKGIDLNLKALGFLQAGGIRDWHYTVVGDGPERPKLESMAARLGIKDRVHFTGRLSHQDAIKAIMEADVFSLPSRKESFGVVYLEAMACGKPVIGCSGTGAADIIVDKENGMLIPPEDVQSLAEAFAALIRNRSLGISMGYAGRQRVRDFTWDRTALSYLDLYGRVLAGV